MIVSFRAILREHAGVELVRIERRAKRQREISFRLSTIAITISA